jgi:hypothetical protein
LGKDIKDAIKNKKIQNFDIKIFSPALKMTSIPAWYGIGNLLEI